MRRWDYRCNGKRESKSEERTGEDLKNKRHDVYCIVVDVVYNLYKYNNCGCSCSCDSLVVAERAIKVNHLCFTDWITLSDRMRGTERWDEVMLRQIKCMHACMHKENQPGCGEEEKRHQDGALSECSAGAGARAHCV